MLAVMPEKEWGYTILKLSTDALQWQFLHHQLLEAVEDFMNPNNTIDKDTDGKED